MMLFLLLFALSIARDPFSSQPSLLEKFRKQAKLPEVVDLLEHHLLRRVPFGSLLSISI